MVKVKRVTKKSHNQNDFYEWLRKYLGIKGQTDEIADLAADATCDYLFPRGKDKTLEDFKCHLNSNYHPIPNAIIALEKAFGMYKGSL